MCNPPFFNKEECEERFQRSDKSDFKNNPSSSNLSRAPPLSATVAKNSELWVHVSFSFKHNIKNVLLKILRVVKLILLRE